VQVLAQVYAAVRDWRAMALSPEVGLLAKELDDFAPAFEHAQIDAARRLLG
jgi:serine/threonine-protein kinase HipA